VTVDSPFELIIRQNFKKYLSLVIVVDYRGSEDFVMTLLSHGERITKERLNDSFDYLNDSDSRESSRGESADTIQRRIQSSVGFLSLT
jgi:hypothetical protein